MRPEANRTTANRADRKRVFDGFFSNYKRAEGSFGANLTGQVMADVFSAKARKFDSSLEAALFAELETGMAAAYGEAGQLAVTGFWSVLIGLIAKDDRALVESLAQG